MNLNTTSYAPLLILVAIVAALADKYLLGGTGWLAVPAGVVGVLSVGYLLYRAGRNLVADFQADRAARRRQQEADRLAREQLAQRISSTNRELDKAVAEARAEQLRQRRNNAAQ